MRFRTILVPVDFSVCAMVVTQQAAELAAQLGARLILMHVAELPGSLPANTPVRPEGVAWTAGEYVLADAEARIDPFLVAARAAGAEVVGDVRVGAVVPGILAAAEAHGASLIVIGTHGRTGLARLVLGSIAEGVAQAARVPVMLVRREVRPECARGSCEWCVREGQSPAEARLSVESEG